MLSRIKIYWEVRKGAPYFYFERYLEHNRHGGTFDTVILGLPLLHVECSVENKNGDRNEEKVEGTA